MKDILVYPVYIQEYEDYYCVRIPDFDQYTEGHTIGEAMMMARDCISSLGIYYEDEGKKIPAPFSVKSSPEGKEKLFMIDVNFDEYRVKYENKMVKKNCTIPLYLEREAEKQGLNFSRILSEALAQRLSIHLS